jgi:hypothetical protein
MVFLRLAYALLFPILLGTGLVNVILAKKTDAAWPERLAFGYLLGLMLITAEMFFILPRLGWRYSILSISAPLSPLLLWGLWATFKNRLFELKFTLPSRQWTLAEKCLLGLIAFNLIFVFASVLIKPVVGVDSWGNYSIRAKAFFLEGTVVVPTLPAADRGQFNALTQAWVFTCLNDWNDILGKINIPFYYLCLLTLFYSAARRYRPRLPALLATFLLATLPFLAYHATLEYSDFIVATYLFAGVSCLWHWLNDPQPKYLLLGALFYFSLITMKNEAFFHLAIVLAVFFLALFTTRFNELRFARQIRAGTIACFVVGAILAGVRIVSIRSTVIFFAPTLDLARLVPLVTVFIDYVFIRSNWGFLWPLLCLVLLFNRRKLRDKYNLFLLAIVGLEFFGLMLFYLVADKAIYGWLFFVTAAVRNQLQFMPVALLLLAALLDLDNPWPAKEKTVIATGRKKARRG